MADVVVITGLSGAGRSGAAAVLEDLGWYVVDNLPTSLVPTIVELAGNPGSDIQRLALVSGRQHADVLPHVGDLRAAGHDVTVLFLDASTPVLVQRYDATRRKHPFADHTTGVLEAIEAERASLAHVRAVADLVIDTSDLNVHELKAELVREFEQVGSNRLQVSFESFGFKNGVPIDADIVMDVRFLPNPHWEEELRDLTGHDAGVRDFVLDRAVTKQFIEKFDDLLGTVLPSYRDEGRSYLTIGIGCTGGRHRSVAITEEIARLFRERGIAVSVRHRDVARPTTG